MKNVFSFFVFLFTGIQIIFADDASLEQVAEFKSKITDLEKMIKDDTVVQLDIYCLPGSVKTFVALTSDHLKRSYKYKLTVKNLGGLSLVKTLLSTFNGVKSFQIRNDFDFRWGFIFSDSSGKEVFSAYFDPFLENGLIQNKYLEMDESLKKGVEEYFQKIFQLKTEQKTGQSEIH